MHEVEDLGVFLCISCLTHSVFLLLLNPKNNNNQKKKNELTTLWLFWKQILKMFFSVFFKKALQLLLCNNKIKHT